MRGAVRPLRTGTRISPRFGGPTVEDMRVLIGRARWLRELPRERSWAALVRVLADDLQVAAENLSGSVDQAAGEALIGPDVLDARLVEPGPAGRSEAADPSAAAGESRRQT